MSAVTPTAARSLVLTLLRRVSSGRLTVIEGARRWEFGAGLPHGTVQVRSPRLWAALLRGSCGLADAYEAGWWDSPDLVAVIRVAARNARGLDRAREAVTPLRWPFQQARALLTANTRSRSRRAIAAHYDLGEALFERMLDPSLTYSCAVFDDEHRTLKQAQAAKLDLVCRKLGLGPGDRVLEIGTGWGGFALHAAATRGCHVTTTTISRDQYEAARARVRAAGLQDRIDVLCSDYRDLRGTYDKLVSIEMIEAVGWRHFGTFLAKCSALLEPHGAMLLQSITIDDRAYEVEKAAKSFANTRIFPGGSLPSVGVLLSLTSRRTDLRALAFDDIGAHYVPTLQEWRRNFEAHAAELERLGYDARFRRIWSLYLAYCEAGFAERRISVVQVLLGKAGYPVSRLRPSSSTLPAPIIRQRSPGRSAAVR